MATFLEIKLVFLIRQTNVAARGEHIVQLFDPFDAGRVTEPLDICITAVWSAPIVIGAGDGGDVFCGKLLGATVDQVAEVAGIDKQDFFGAIAKALTPSPSPRGRGVEAVAAQKPQAGGDLSVQKQLGGQIDDAVHQPRLDQRLADVTLARAFGGERALGEHETGLSAGVQVIEEVLNPGVVGVAGGRHAVLPAAHPCAADRRSSRCR